MVNEGDRRIILIGFSAIIGCGKTSLLKRLEKLRILSTRLPNAHISFVREPEDLWVETLADGRRVNWLEEFYADRDMNAQPFQTIVFDTHIQVVEEAIEKAKREAKEGQDIVILIERTMYDQLLFWKLQVDSNLATTTPIFDSAYMRIWNRWNRFIPHVSLIFFLKTGSLDGTMARLRRRERLAASLSGDKSVFHISVDGDAHDATEANGVPRDYQQLLLDKHLEWYTEPVARPLHAPPQGVPCVHINIDAPYHENDASLDQLGAEIAQHIAGIIMSE
jgi:deoxyadenosine/deoxycytidine kinase